MDSRPIRLKDRKPKKYNRTEINNRMPMATAEYGFSYYFIHYLYLSKTVVEEK